MSVWEGGVFTRVVKKTIKVNNRGNSHQNELGLFFKSCSVKKHDCIGQSGLG